MRATDIVRRIDELGRVVIPKEIRRTLPRGRPATDGIGRRCAGGRADASGAAGGRDRAEKEICVKAENRMIERGLQKLRFFNRIKKTKRIPP